MDAAGLDGEIIVDSRSLQGVPKELCRVLFPRLRFKGAEGGECDTVYLGGSSALSLNLLERFNVFSLHPRDRPCLIDRSLYWVIRSSVLEPTSLQLLSDVDRVLPGRIREWWSEIRPVGSTVTLISSIYDGDRFLPQFLENMSSLNGYDQTEHLLIRAASPGNEHPLLLNHVSQYENAAYVDLVVDPGLYEVWNRAARWARAPYLSTANIDDRRAPQHLNRLVEVLERRPEIDVASSTLRVTHEPNTPWERSTNDEVMFAHASTEEYGVESLLTGSRGQIRSYNIPHCMPVWRRELHAKHGGFDELSYGPSADWEFWLRVGTDGVRFLLLNEPLGLFLRADSSYWARGTQGGRYDLEIGQRYGYLLDPARSRSRFGMSSRSLVVTEATNALELVVGLARELEAAGASQDPRELRGSEVRVAELLGSQFIDPLQRLSGIHHEPSPKFWQRLLFFAADCCDWFAQRDGPAGRMDVGVRLILELANAGLEISEDDKWLLVRSRILGIIGEASGEANLLHELHARDRRWFWESVQSVYRFSLPLGTLADISGSSVVPVRRADGLEAESLQVWFCPQYSGNAYQSLLYQGFQDRGGKTVGLQDGGAIHDVHPPAVRQGVLHVHWLNIFSRGVDPAIARLRFEVCLADLRRLKSRGIKIFWTVHNRVNHEASGDRGAEILFRQRLYRLADRVYVHHPLAIELLDWLPGTEKIRLIEHGPFPVLAGDRYTARRNLGFAADDLLLLHFGIVRKYKGLEVYLPDIQRFLDSNDRAKFVIAGRIEDEAVRRLLTEAPHPGLHVVNHRLSEEELSQYLHAADYGFLSYADVLTSGALFHLLSYGVPVIAPRAGLITPYVVDGWNGYLYSDGAELKDVLHSVSLRDRAEYVRYRQNAARAANSLSWRFP
jgi:glycosyltransferase involved in cell wall biosynthesis